MPINARLLLASAVLAIVTGCTTQEQRLEAWRQKCDAKGLERGTEAHANCVREEIVSQQRR